MLASDAFHGTYLRFIEERRVMPHVLMVLTAAKVWTMKNGFPHPTGFWAEEFIRPHEVFGAAGFTIDIATPGGKRRRRTL
jgi:hypothetical protein